MKSELLAPAGSFEAFIEAIYNGADAVYLACNKYGARAYAKNFTIDELKKALTYSHVNNKKIYVTVNTIIKEEELSDCKNFLDELYEIGVDGIITCDNALISYIKSYLSPMECHISTQAGIKDLYDVKFFENFGVDRCVLAREDSLDEIRKIKANSKMPLEVFIYGALCVSYSGGCLLSSILTLRSGNRGRCSQNCRREYSLYKDGRLKDKGFMLSMKDLNTIPKIKELTDLGIDSLKIEGRMKSPEYVKTVTSEIRNKIDNPNYKLTKLDTVFHRAYSKGFIFNEDKGNIVDINKKANEGAYIGYIKGKRDKLTEIVLTRPLNISDRIRIEGTNDDYFFTIDKIYNQNNKEIDKGINECYLNIYKDFPINSKIYKMLDSTIETSNYNNKKIPLTIDVYGKEGSPLVLSSTIDDNYFQGESTNILSLAKSQSITKESLFKNLNKLNETPFFLDSIDLYIDDNLFLNVAGINEARRNLINSIMEYYQGKRILKKPTITKKTINYSNYDLELTAYCTTKEQYNACKDIGLKTIYFNNYSSYVNSNYPNFDENYVLVGNYGGIYYYSDKKDIITDSSFNVINSEAIHFLLENNAKYVTLSPEVDSKELINIHNSYKKKYSISPPIEFIIYGYQTLMTLKYCPLKRYGECGDCSNHSYTLKDEFSEFKTIRKNCITSLLNSLPLNLIPNLNEITPYAKRLRLNFTIENYDEVINIITSAKNKLNGENVKATNSTKGYFKRPIL